MLNVEQLRLRIEILEELLQQRGGGGGGGSSPLSFAGPVVANQAAASALPLATYTTAREVYTLAQEAIWQYIPGVPGTVGVPPLVPDEVIPAAGGVLARTSYSSPKWRTAVNDVFIDPANPAASDENDGFTALTPLKTGQELFRRWGWGAPVVISCNLATSPDTFMNVHIVSSIVSPDQLDVNVILASNCSLRFVGGTPTTIRTSTLTGASTAMNPAAPLGGTRLRLVDAATATWVPDMAPNRRGRITTGAQAGATFQPQTNVGVGGAVDCSAAQTTNEPGFSFTPTTVTPAAGSTYVIESLVQCNFGLFHIAQEINPTFGGFNAFVNFVNLNFPATPNQGWAPISDGLFFSGAFLNFYQCTFDRDIDLTMVGNANLVACYYFNSGIFNFSSGAPVAVNGGGMNATNPSFGTVLWSCKNQNSVLDFNFVANNSIVAIDAFASVKNFASWNAHVLAGVNTAGHGVLVGIIGFSGLRGTATLTGLIWGNGNGGAGLLIGANCSCAGAPQNITGVQQDFKLCNKLVGWWFNDATAAYNPIGGSVPTSWANLTAAEGAAGFGGNAHELDSNSHFVALETTA